VRRKSWARSSCQLGICCFSTPWLASRANSPRFATGADLYPDLLGAAFAGYELRAVLRTIPERCELEATDPRPERMRRRAITFVPSRVARSCGEPTGVSVASRSR
jgi:hypothetical protein